jgi:hypothetical protein
MNITTKMTVYSTCILAMVLGLLLTMNYFKYGNILTEVTTSRLAVINKNLKFSLSRATNLGLALEELQFADAMLMRAKESDPAIREILVFGNTGKVLFSTDGTAPDSRMENSVVSLLEPLKKKDATEWVAHTDEQFVAGITLYNSFDRSIGGVVLRYDRANYHALVEGILQNLVFITAVLLGVSGLVALVGISFGFRELRHTYSAMQAALAKVRESGGTDGDVIEDQEVEDFKTKLGSVTRTMDEAMTQIEVSAATSGITKA